MTTSALASSITAIALELASSHPSASPQNIADAIIESIESEPFIIECVTNLQFPTRRQITLANLRSQRLPKRRPDILARIDNVYFMRKIQGMYTLPLQESSTSILLHIDGARVDLLSPVRFPDRSHSQLTTQVPVPTSQSEKEPSLPRSPSSDLSTLFSDAKLSTFNTQDTDVSPLNVLKQIEDETTPTQFLTLYKAHLIISLITIVRDQPTILSRILRLLTRDIATRNRIYKTNCIRELYRGQDKLPEARQIKPPKISDVTGLISEAMKAIILHEYGRWYEYHGQQFINKQITYDKYLKLTERLIADAEFLFSAI